jgi:hypothetical protein
MRNPVKPAFFMGDIVDDEPLSNVAQWIAMMQGAVGYWLFELRLQWVNNSYLPSCSLCET